MARLTVFSVILALSSFLDFSILVLAQQPQTVLNPGYGFSFIGCYNEVPNSRALTAAKLTSAQTNMTVEVCAQFCSSYTFFGVEYASECTTNFDEVHRKNLES